MSSSQPDIILPNLFDVDNNKSTDNEIQEVEMQSINVARALKRKRKDDKPPTNTKSKAWDYFTKKIVDGVQMATCNHCGTDLKAPYQSGTTHLNRHMRNCAQKHQAGEEGETRLRTTSGVDKHEFDQSIAQEKIVKMIIMHELPLRFVEYVGFRDMMKYVNPLVNPMSRNTLKSEIFKLFEIERSKTMRLLESIESRVAITTDLWAASNQKNGYMVVTAHFIDNSWKLHSRILRVIYVSCPHNTETLCNELMQCLLDWNVDGKLSTTTLDNCSTNDAMVERLLVKFPADTLILGGKLFHMRCVTNILNLIVKDGMQVIQGGIGKIRESVSFWTATPERIETFTDVAYQLQIKVDKVLALDCPTSWNSTYTMLEVAVMYKDVFTRLKHRESHYKSLPSKAEWESASMMVVHLRSFHNLTEMFSGTKYPPVNLYFPVVCKMRLSINEWFNSSHPVMRNMASNMVAKFEKYWSDIHGVLVVAVVLDPRFKMKLVDFYFPKIFGQNASEQVNRVHVLCNDLVAYYESKTTVEKSMLEREFDLSVGDTSSTSKSVEGYWDSDEFDTFITQNIPPRQFKSELDSYLEEDLVKRTVDFDILTWWKVHKGKYPILAEMAKDILAIPVSTVASESAFSIRDRCLSRYYSKLHPNTLEALVCTQNWMWAPIRGEVPKKEIFTGEEDDGEGPQALSSCDFVY